MKHLSLLLAALVTTMFASSQSPKLKITHLTGNIYVYTTYNLYQNTPVPSNSAYLVTDNGVVLFDTPWDTTQFQPLLDSIEAKHHQPVVLSISTHFHEDRTGGIDFLKSKGISTWSSQQTLVLCKEKGEPQAAHQFAGDTTFRIGSQQINIFYPGPGHAPDNILIWLPKDKVLYGGCFVKSTEATSLGNLSDANVDVWPSSIHKVMKKFPTPAYIIPGHDGWADKRSLQHTLQLLKQYNASKKAVH